MAIRPIRITLEGDVPLDREHYSSKQMRRIMKYEGNFLAVGDVLIPFFPISEAKEYVLDMSEEVNARAIPNKSYKHYTPVYVDHKFEADDVWPHMHGKENPAETVRVKRTGLFGRIR